MNFLHRVTNKQLKDIARLFVFTAEEVHHVYDTDSIQLTIKHHIVDSGEIRLVEDIICIDDYYVWMYDTSTESHDVEVYRKYMYQLFGDVYAREFLLTHLTAL